MKVAFFLALSTIFWGINFHLAKVLLSQVGFIEAGFWRYLFGISTLLILAVRRLPSPQLLFENLKGITAVGVVGLFGFNIFFFLGFLLLLPISGMENIMTHTPGFWYAVIGIGCFGTGIAYYTWNNGIKLSGADRAGIFMNIVPLSTAVFSVFFNESLYLYHLVSGIIILMGLYVMKNKTRKNIA